MCVCVYTHVDMNIYVHVCVCLPRTWHTIPDSLLSIPHRGAHHYGGLEQHWQAAGTSCFLHPPGEALNQVTCCDLGWRSPATPAGDPTCLLGSLHFPSFSEARAPRAACLRQLSLQYPTLASRLLSYLCAQGPVSLHPRAFCPLLVAPRTPRWRMVTHRRLGSTCLFPPCPVTQSKEHASASAPSEAGPDPAQGRPPTCEPHSLSSLLQREPRPPLRVGTDQNHRVTGNMVGGGKTGAF